MAKKVILGVIVVFVLCFCCCMSFFGFIGATGFGQVDGICTFRGPFYNGKECPEVGYPVRNTNFDY